MNLPRCLHWRRAAPPPRLRRPPAPDWVNAGPDAAEAAVAAAPRGCGWFDSSHELQAGLQVTEHLTPEPVVNEGPLGWWLDWQSQGVASAAKLQPAWQGLPRR